jgi:hypothetical protein
MIEYLDRYLTAFLRAETELRHAVSNRIRIATRSRAIRSTSRTARRIVPKYVGERLGAEPIGPGKK